MVLRYLGPMTCERGRGLWENRVVKGSKVSCGLKGDMNEKLMRMNVLLGAYNEFLLSIVLNGNEMFMGKRKKKKITC